ncbi:MULTISPECIES: Eco57I restriction-modification methylase domain-containing protein [unclassified Alcaligenes]|uniref:Eco57I restriction-modification methylase domain-containing protein n=1 Tax=Alcaligenes TaxID=507 RepID=UPI0002AA8397|nr:N-6 DNA methylase [Alcaligenes sp. HPC1271]EKU31667.1 hypothetical protein C660_02485 [Alcaligenes sp. HPC1271]ERI34687.1 hypothetical protein N879_03880 [Alcaligenes sp. EGD-AK7]HRO22383.1 Eco57I restriction-modification methylase domain-containing protein [Alcaligenes phenolicus]HRP13340.1 Eco57I restriction-modification methylase domain-containing protein [Alcaligenes phenolicus]
MTTWDRIETERLNLQALLDDQKTSEDRNRMGQFATPTALAREIVAHGVSLLPKGERVRFLDPGIGTGSFYSALRATTSVAQIESATGFEIDPHYYGPAQAFWKDHALDLRHGDFTHAQPEGHARANVIICNPPYVRHHHLDSEAKASLQHRSEAACGVRISGLSGLYCYFMGLSHPWMEEGGIAGWLIPSEFMDVNYGQQVKQYLLTKVTLLQIHRFDPSDVQFADALVSSAVVWFRNAKPPKDHEVLFSYGGTLATPAMQRHVPATTLQLEPKWTRYPMADGAAAKGHVSLGDLFDVKRGLATGDNSFFIMTRTQIEDQGLPFECFTPVLPSTRYLPSDEILADADGTPILDKQLFLLNTRLSEDEIAHRYPTLKAYLDTGKIGEKPVSGGYLCKSRSPWYAQEKRPAAPFLCTYMGRQKEGKRPFRFFLNHSCATACNTYLLLYPKPSLARILDRDPELKRTIWEFLNAITPEELLGNGRVYGGGLHKMEPRELRNVSVDDLIDRLPQLAPHGQQVELFEPVFLDGNGPSADLPAFISTTNAYELYGLREGETVSEAIVRNR